MVLIETVCLQECRVHRRHFIEEEPNDCFIEEIVCIKIRGRFQYSICSISAMYIGEFFYKPVYTDGSDSFGRFRQEVEIVEIVEGFAYDSSIGSECNTDTGIGADRLQEFRADTGVCAS